MSTPSHETEEEDMQKLARSAGSIIFLLALMLYARMWLYLPYFYLVIAFATLTAVLLVSHFRSSEGARTERGPAVSTATATTVVLTLFALHESFTRGEIQEIGHWPGEVVVYLPVFLLDFAVPIAVGFIAAVAAERRRKPPLIWGVAGFLASTVLKYALARAVRFGITGASDGSLAFGTFVVTKAATTAVVVAPLLLLGRKLMGPGPERVVVGQCVACGRDLKVKGTGVRRRMTLTCRCGATTRVGYRDSSETG